MQEEPFRYAPQELSTPGAQIFRNHDAFSHFIVSYDKLRKGRTPSDALLAAKALVACVSSPGEGDLEQAFAMIGRLLSGDVNAWIILFRSAIESEIDASILTSLKKLFQPDPSRLLVVKQITHDESVTIIGKDARRFWIALLSGRCAHRICESEDKVSIHLLEENEKMWI